MIKLFTLSNISSYSEDALYKICLSLDKYDLFEEPGCEDYDELLKKALKALSEGNHVLVAAETPAYNQLKKTFLSNLSAEPGFSSAIGDAIEKSSERNLADEEKKEHTLVPAGSVSHLTLDGLYCGFSFAYGSGTLTFMPLDFMRIDSVIEGFLGYLNGDIKEDVAPKAEAPAYDFQKNVGRMVETLFENDCKLALVTGESTMWIYELYKSVPRLTEVACFVDVIDSDEEAENEEEPSESVKLVGKARDAMNNAQCNLGAAISEVFTATDDDGNESYFAYVAVVDKNVAKAKKLSTGDPQDLELLLPHAVTLLCETVSSRVKALNESPDETGSETVKPQNGKKLSKDVIIFACVVLAVALIIPIGIMFRILNEEPPSTQPSISIDIPGSSAGGSNPFEASSTTVPTQPNHVPQSSAPDVSAPTPTVPPIASKKGIFTFYVFGYGHGVGMSQVGANYLAQQGWTAAEILAHYYYDPNAKIVAGEKYPDKITYDGTQYDTREYLACALETEMGSSFSYEALKAQAIAIYTFAKYNGYNLSKDAHAFGKTPSELCYRVADDVINTGYYIAYGNDVAVTPFHSMSAGKTTSYYNVWGKGIGATVPYLAGGRQSYGDYQHQNFKSLYTITSEDLKKIVKEKLSIDLTGDPATWLTIVTHDQAVREDIGYVSSMSVGGTIITGYEFRIKVLDGAIRSHCFTIVYTPES